MLQPRFSVLALSALVLAVAGPALAQDTLTHWEPDLAHSSAQFAVRHLGVSTVRGTFSNITGHIAIDEQDLSKSTVDVTIDATTVNTRNERRDNHLKSPDFFDIASFPTMTFKSKKVERAPEGLRVTGDFTLHGVTKEIVLDVEGPTPPFNMGNRTKRGASASTRINRKDFGLAWSNVVEGVAIVGDDVQITIDLELNQR